MTREAGARRDRGREARGRPAGRGLRAGLWLSAAVLLGGACAAPAPPPPAAAPPRSGGVFVLLPDPGSRPGAITVSNAAGSQELSQPGQAVRVGSATEAPGAPAPMDDAEVTRLFGEALAAQPPAPAHFLLYFNEGTDELVPASRALLPDVLRVIRERRSTDVSVIGHTDTVGDRQLNYRLGLRRAERVAQLLQSVGVEASILDVRSLGEEYLLVPTGDGIAEPRNRRVEVTVR